MTQKTRKKNTVQRLLGQRSWRLAHRWIGMALFLPFLALAVTGSLLTRPDWFREGRVFTAYAISPDRPSLHAKAGSTDLWLSRDSGASFTELFPPGGVQDVVDLAFSPDGSALYVAQKEWGLLKEVDGIWEQVTLPFDPAQERILLEKVSVPGPGRLVLKTSGALWLGEGRSAGLTWRKLAAFEPSGFYRELHAWHSGWRFGTAGMRVVEILGWASVILAVTGVVLFFRSRRKRN